MAQKFLHNAIYTMSTWAHTVCEDRADLHKDNLRLAEHLIVKYIDWKIWPIADPNTVAALYNNCFDEADAAFFRYENLLPQEHEKGDDNSEPVSQSPPNF